jgi:hypothetical protein
MPADFDIKGWLKSVGVAEDVATEIAGKVSDEKALTNWKGAVMAQSDYSRNMDALRKKEQQLQADADAKVQKELAEIAKYRGESDTNFQRAVSERVKAEQDLIAVRAQIEGLARDYALPNDAIDPILRGVPARQQDDEAARRRAEAERARSNDLDPRYLTVERFGKEAGAYSMLPIEYAQIAGEYEDLFKSNAYRRASSGTPSAMERILERAKTDKVDLRAAFEREFNVSAKRDEIRAAEQSAAIATAVAEAEKRVRSQIAAENPGVTSARTVKLPGSPALASAGAPERAKDNAGNAIPFQRVNSAQAHQDRVSRAVSSFNESLEKNLAS